MRNENCNCNLTGQKPGSVTLGVVMTLLACLLLPVFPAWGADWQADGGSLNMNTGEIAWGPRIAAVGSTPYVVWYENVPASAVTNVYVKYYNGTYWDPGQNLNVKGTFHGQAPSIASGNGLPYVAWHEFLSSKLYLFAKYYNGTAWEQLGGSITGGWNTAADYPSIAVYNGTAYVAYSQNNSALQIMVKHYNGSDWQQDGNILNMDSGQNAEYPHLVFYNGTPFVIWHENNSAGKTQIYVKHYNGSSWEQDGVGSLNINPAASAQLPHLAFVNGTPYAAWSEPTGIYVKRYSGGVWTQIGAGGPLNVDPSKLVISSGIAVSGGTPYVVWSEDNGAYYQVYVKHLNGTNWVQDGGSLNLSTSQSAYDPRIADVGGTPYVTWYESNSAGIYQTYVKHWGTPNTTPTIPPTPTPTPPPTTPTPTPTAIVNLISNPSFETGGAGAPANWTTQDYNSSAVFSWETGDPFDGNKSVSIAITNPSGDDASWTQTITGLTPGLWYNLSVWMKTDNVVSVTGSGGAGICFDGSGYRSTTISGTHDYWQGVFGTAPAVSTSMQVDCRLGFTGNLVTGKAWFDSVLAWPVGAWRDTTHFSMLLEDHDLASIQPANYTRWLDHLNNTYAAYADLVGTVPYSGDKIQIVSVRHNLGAWAVAGNPILWMQGYIGDELMNINDRDEWSFGILHEIGHDFDIEDRWVWQAEFWANLKMYYVIKTLNGLVYPVYQSEVGYQGVNLRNYYLSQYNLQKSQGHLGEDAFTYRFITISEAIGWDPFKQTLRYFLSLPTSEVPTQAYAKFDLFLAKLSEFSGLDVRTLFLPEELTQINQELGEPVLKVISGQVRNAAGSGLSGVLVSLSGDQTQTYRTDNQGYYVFSNLPVGNYTVTPALAPYVFAPAAKSYAPLYGVLPCQDFIGRAAPQLNSIGNQMLAIGQGIQFTVTAADLDGDTLTYSVSNLPTGAVFGSATGVFSWTPGAGQAGVYPNIHFGVSDGFLAAYEDITITVREDTSPPPRPYLTPIPYAPSGDQPPGTITFINPGVVANQSIQIGQRLEFTVTATDQNGTSLILSASNLPAGAAFDSATGVFSWTPAPNQAGVYTAIHFTVLNGPAAACEDITITVEGETTPAVLDRPFTYPNPYRPNGGQAPGAITFNRLGAARTKISIYSLSGRLLREIEEDPVNGKIAWNLKDKNNINVPSGTYLYAITDATGKQARGKIAIIK
jgi:hypothetical protein